MAQLVFTTIDRITGLPITQSSVDVRDILEADDLMGTALGIMLADDLITAYDVITVAADWADARRRSNGGSFLSAHPMGAHFNMTFTYLV